MENPRSPPGSVRRHGRNISHPTPRQTARGPLEEATDDPLAAGTQPSNSPSVPDETPSTASGRGTASSTPQLPAASASTTKPIISLHFLQDSDSYHQLFADDIPKAFLDSEHQPSLDATVPELLQGGHFRRAADKSLRDLLASPSNAIEQILQLLYTRLACLTLISRPDLAAQEAIPLIDLLARSSAAGDDLLPLVPWELRLLLVRLQSIGAADGGRRGIMALYALAGEVRANLRSVQQNGDDASAALWAERLQDLGLRVCDALVEMGELETATRHLDTLKDVDADELAYRKALLRVRVGDVSGARLSASNITDVSKKKGFEALLEVADGEYSVAVESFRNLMAEYPEDEQFAQNAAVALLYTGKITSARDLLEDLASRTPVFPTLLFNLSTVYELCSERAPERKTALTEQAAAKEPGPQSGGWERATFEFKL
ncbi:hypothetical protein PRZ48_013049 [Zasmidium cellare]|uniref:Uncharacterized protein n=1 Tax=Zasmidium cellare TaxID=395010 RepID=A0ABR0E2Y7_ZASCE|nr:hypothetical protein PRZ48_013049 [Zasmidium cellare]